MFQLIQQNTNTYSDVLLQPQSWTSYHFAPYIFWQSYML